MPKTGVEQWDSTASNNADIGGVDIAENCAAAGINNALRELMAQIATSIELPLLLPVTTGTSSAYVVTTGLSLTSLPTGKIFQVRFHAECADDATLNIDSIGAVDLYSYRRDDSFSTVKAGNIQVNTTLFLRYDGTQYQILAGQGYRSQEDTFHAVKTSDQTKTSDTTAAVDDDLQLVAAIPGVYRVEAQIIHNAGAGAIKFRIADPSTGTISYQVNNGATVYAGTANYTDSDTSATDRVTTMRGLVTVTSSTGVQFYWAQSSSNAADTIVKSGSYLTMEWLGAS